MVRDQAPRLPPSRTSSSTSERWPCATDDGVGGSVVDGEPVAVDERRGGEDDVRDVADTLVGSLGREQVAAATRDDAPGLVEIEDRGAE